jgi:uncharacterized protein (TIGR03437 family)
MPAPQVNTSGGPGTIVLTWLGVLEPNLTTGTVNLGELLATIPSSASVGQSYLVATPGGSGQVTAAVVDTLIPGATVTLSVANPPPVALWTLPSSATPGGAGLTVTVNGQGFTTTSVVLWNGSARTTVFLSETQLQASITAADISAASTAQLTVSNPAPGGGLSGSLPFLISGLAAPVINTSGIVSNAQYTTSLAGNTIASVFGQNLAASTALATSLPLPTTLGGVSVLVDGVAAPLFYVSPLQINLQLPWRLLNQTQTSIVVVSNGLSSAVTTIPLTATAPAIYSLNAQGNGQGAILQANSGTVVAPLNSIPGVVTQPGSPLEFISIFCTGLGAVQTYTFGDGTAATAATTVASTQVTIGGVAATVTYAGLAPSYVGLYQINAVIPTGVPSGSAIPVIVKINGITSNTVTIAIQ